MDKTDLVALVGSRICHDLVSPLGAIGNGLELMLLAGGEETPEMALVTESLGGAAARIRYFRLAFGAAGDGTMVRTAEIEEALGAIRTPRLSVSWQVPGDALRRDAKLALLAVNCVESAMPIGGQITITRDGPQRWSIHGAADRLRPEGDSWGLLQGAGTGDADITPAQVHFALLARDAGAQDRAIVVKEGAGEIGISF